MLSESTANVPRQRIMLSEHPVRASVMFEAVLSYYLPWFAHTPPRSSSSLSLVPLPSGVSRLAGRELLHY